MQNKILRFNLDEQIKGEKINLNMNPFQEPSKYTKIITFEPPKNEISQEIKFKINLKTNKISNPRIYNEYDCINILEGPLFEKIFSMIKKSDRLRFTEGAKNKLIKEMKRFYYNILKGALTFYKIRMNSFSNLVPTTTTYCPFLFVIAPHLENYVFLQNFVKSGDMDHPKSVLFQHSSLRPTFNTIKFDDKSIDQYYLDYFQYRMLFHVNTRIERFLNPDNLQLKEIFKPKVNNKPNQDDVKSTKSNPELIEKFKKQNSYEKRIMNKEVTFFDFYSFAIFDGSIKIPFNSKPYKENKIIENK